MDLTPRPGKRLVADEATSVWALYDADEAAGYAGIILFTTEEDADTYKEEAGLHWYVKTHFPVWENLRK